MNFPIKLLSLLLLLISVNGCSFLPLPLVYLNHGKTIYDTGGVFMDYPTSNDILLSSMTGKHCRFINVFAGEDVCKEKSATGKHCRVINVFAGEDVCREKSATGKMQEYIDPLKEVN